MEKTEFQELGLIELNLSELKDTNGGFWPVLIGATVLAYGMASKAFDLGREYAREH